MQSSLYFYYTYLVVYPPRLLPRRLQSHIPHNFHTPDQDKQEADSFFFQVQNLDNGVTQWLVPLFKPLFTLLDCFHHRYAILSIIPV